MIKDDKTKRIEYIQFGCFVIVCGILYGIWLLLCIYGKPEAQYNLFFAKGENYMADLFNVMYYSKDRAPYISEINAMAEKAYFPLSYVICYVLASLSNLNWNIQGHGGIQYNGRAQTLDSMTIVIGVLFMTVLMIVVAILVYEMGNGAKWKKVLLTCAIMLSGVVIYTYERGNLIMLALAGVLLFLATYDSSDKRLRELGYIALAVAGALKGYPAILGLILIYRHEWKEVLRLLIYGIVFAFGPFLLLKGGFSNIPYWLNNLHQNSELYMFLQHQRVGYLYFITYMKDADQEDMLAVYHICKPIITIVGCYSVFVSYFQKKRWLQMCTLLTFIIIYPVNSGYYCLLYIIPVVILYLNEQEKSWKDLLYLPLLVMLLTPLQFIHHGSNYTIWMDNIILMVLLGICLIDNTISMISCIREKKFMEVIKHGVSSC